MAGDFFIILVFWENHADAYPNLATLARVYLTHSASSVLSDRGNRERSYVIRCTIPRLDKLCFVHDYYGRFSHCTVCQKSLTLPSFSETFFPTAENF